MAPITDAPLVRSSPAARRWLTNKRLFQWHGWLGLNVGLLLFIICFSGAVAALSHEIDWLLNPAIRAWPNGQQASWGAWHESVRRALPGARISSLHAPLNRHFAAEVIVETPAGQTRRVYVNPYTGAMQGHTSYFNVQRFLRSFHMMFFVPSWGLSFVSFFGLVLLLSVTTGLLFYRNWWRNLFRLRLTKGRRAFWSDAHRMLGVWTLLFALVIGGTGVWYFVEHLLGSTGNSVYIPPPKLTRERLARHGPAPRPLAVDECLRLAQAALPGLRVRTLGWPAEPDDAVYVDGQTDALLVRDRANKVFLDPYDGTVVRIQRAEELGPLLRWVDTADPLHFGDFGGVPTKVLWALLGLALPAMVLSGAYLSLRAGARARRTRGGVSWAGLATVAVFVPVSYWTTHEISAYGAPPLPRLARVADERIGPWQVQLLREGPVLPGEATAFRLRFPDPARAANYHRAWLRAGVETGEGVLFAVGSGADVRAVLPTPASVMANAGLEIVMEAQDGARHGAVVTADRWQGSGEAVAMKVADSPFTAPGVFVFLAGLVAVMAAVAVLWLRFVG